MKTKIAVAKGDGIGPEIMDAVISIFDATNVPLEYLEVEMSKSVFEKGFSTGMTPEAVATIENCAILYKGPMETPKGGGVKSINVTARKVWNTYANVRKFRTLKGVDTIFSNAGIPINMTILRENIEDTYGGIEFLHNPDTAISYRLISRQGTEQFIRFCFEYAKKQGHKRLTCGHKANIMKMTDGLFLSVFYEISKEYPEITVNDVIVDDLAMKLVRFPDSFELVCLPNLQGDIISDLCAGLVGGLGFAPSSNIGDSICIFEAVHGTAPDIAGKGIANPTSLLLSGIMMLRHLGFISHADKIENSLLHTLEQGIHTGDFGDKSIPSVGTQAFADAIIKNLGQNPTEAPVVNTGTPDFEWKKPENTRTEIKIFPETKYEKATVKGADLFITTELHPKETAALIQSILPEGLTIQMISNRGTQVWPTASVFTDSIPHFRVRIYHKDTDTLNRSELISIVAKIAEVIEVEDIEILKEWGSIRGYSLAQGQ